MFSKKKAKPQIDKEQLELIENAQRRIKQKKRLYIHFVIFLIGAIFLIIANEVLVYGKDFRPFNQDWFVTAIFIWLFIFLYHVFNVFVTDRFMGKEWEQKQLDKLVGKQQARIDQIKTKLKHDSPLFVENEAQKKSLDEKSGITIIVAAGENDSIGKDNKLIWHLSDDLKRFKELTSGHHIIMGRKTFESFPDLLPNRTHVVISSQKDYKVPEGVIVVKSLVEALNIAKDDPQPFIIGGGQIYEQAMEIADKIELTRVHENFGADTFFPKIDKTKWKEVSNILHKKDAEHAYDFSYITYVRL
jgi:dihydrofolate reductase